MVKSKPGGVLVASGHELMKMVLPKKAAHEEVRDSLRRNQGGNTLSGDCLLE